MFYIKNKNIEARVVLEKRSNIFPHRRDLSKVPDGEDADARHGHHHQERSQQEEADPLRVLGRVPQVHGQGEAASKAEEVKDAKGGQVRALHGESDEPLVVHYFPLLFGGFTLGASSGLACMCTLPFFWFSPKADQNIIIAGCGVLYRIVLVNNLGSVFALSESVAFTEGRHIKVPMQKGGIYIPV